MKSISQQTLDKIHRLDSRCVWSRGFAHSEEQIQLLREIGFSGETSAISEIAWLLIDANDPVWRAAAEAVHRLLETLAPLDLASLDQHIRDVGSDREVDQRWRKLRPSDLTRFASSEFAASLLGLASFHGSGYVREAAVQHLAAQNNGNELPYLLIRLNDWVGPVRDAAVLAVNARIRPDFAHHFLRDLPLVLRLQSCGRVNRSLVELVFALLRRADCKNILQAGMKSSNRAVRRVSFQLAAEAEPSSRTVIIRAALADTDPTARAWAVRRFLPEVPAEDLPSFVAPMLADRFMPVRRAAFCELATKCPDSAAEPLRRALLDNHVGLREVARHFLTKTDLFDARQFYLDALKSPEAKTFAAAIRGVGETGEPKDAVVVLEFLNSPKPHLRRAATYAIGRLDGERFVSQLMRALADEMPSVSREAKKALLPKARQHSLVEYGTLFASDKRGFVRRNVLALMLQFGKWEKLPLLIMACADEDKGLAGLAQQGLSAWLRNYNSSFAEPTRTDFHKIRDALTSAESNLPHGAAAEIHACLKIYFK